VRPNPKGQGLSLPSQEPMMAFIDTLLAELPVMFRIVLAMGLAAIIGAEREIADKPAGLRTHMLVAGAAALFVPLGSTMVQDFASIFPETRYSADPVRIIQSIVIGISFLGAGTIVHRDGRGVEGLTTAASILFTAGLGVAVALQRTVLSIGATLLAFLTLRLIGFVETKMWDKKEKERTDHA
jgi:putative Mg2+ transporter-C (MgtC) family protein